ncbi:hypothetical protein DPV78_009735, partial [Talaromyces pinophilus]
KEPSQDGAGKAPGADALKGSKQKRAERRATLEFSEALGKEFGLAKLYDDHPEKLFDYVCHQIENLQRAATKAQKQNHNGGSVDDEDKEVASLQE